ncbi:MAG: putative HNH endonuclease [Caudoviricetes sp.]|nr:MAG: putative HNH endonuclease [Caudoviricetes sp.]
MKTCTLCKIEKPLEEFSKRKDQKDGLHFYCRLCLKIKKAESYQKNREKALAIMATYRKENPEKVAAAKKAAYAKKPEHYKAKGRARYLAERKEIRARAKAWKTANPERRAKTESDYRKKKYREDPVYALETICRARLLQAFSAKRVRKGSPTGVMLGCSYSELMVHLESQFKDGMTWENRGTAWHVDHRTPLASARSAEELTALCHFTNLQPLWAEDNYAKGAKMPEEWEGLANGRQDHLQA